MSEPTITVPNESPQAAEAFEGRLKRLEGEDRDPKPKRKDLWEKLQAASPLLTAVVVAVLGYFLNDAVSAGFKRQELQLSNVKEMRELIATLLSENTTMSQADEAALALSAFGTPALGPLLTALSAGDEVRAPAAEKALRAIGFSDPKVVCTPMIRTLGNQTGRFNWLTHLSAIRLIGDLECRRARSVVDRYRSVLSQVTSADKLSVFATVVDPSLPLNMDSVDQLKAELDRTARILEARRWWSWCAAF